MAFHLVKNKNNNKVSSCEIRLQLNENKLIILEIARIEVNIVVNKNHIGT
jgi:hypothetical protein